MIESIFTSLGAHLQTNDWIGTSNRYRSKIIEKLETDADSAAIDDASLAEYIAASAPLHCADGWSFLGRALTCHAHGDGDAARHFAYYAELRGQRPYSPLKASVSSPISTTPSMRPATAGP